MVESCMLCAQNESLWSSEILTTLQKINYCRLRSLGKERTETVADRHCLLYAWATGFNVTKSAVANQKSAELMCHTSHYSNFLTWNFIKGEPQDYLIKKIYKNDDMDILLSALSNTFQCMWSQTLSGPWKNYIG